MVRLGQRLAATDQHTPCSAPPQMKTEIMAANLGCLVAINRTRWRLFVDMKALFLDS